MSNIELKWENLDEIFVACKDDGEAYNALCEQSKPSDFYFAVADTDDGIYICITPKVYFDKEACAWDQSMNLEHILPEDCEELMECTWGSERAKEEVSKDLIARGFGVSEAFDELIENSYE